METTQQNIIINRNMYLAWDWMRVGFGGWKLAWG